MKYEHKEIIRALEKIPKLYKEFTAYEKSLGAGASEEKKKVSRDSYLTKILNFEANEKNSKGLKRQLFINANILSNAQPDFKLSCDSEANLKRYISAVGRVGVSERSKHQMNLIKLLEVKAEFKTVDDLLNAEKVKALETYLKGRK